MLFALLMMLSAFAQESPDKILESSSIEELKTLIGQDIHQCLKRFPETQLTSIQVFVSMDASRIKKLEIMTLTGHLATSETREAEISCIQQRFAAREITEENLAVGYHLRIIYHYPDDFDLDIHQTDAVDKEGFPIPSQELFDAAFGPDSDDEGTIDELYGAAYGELQPDELTIAERLDALEQRVVEVRRDVDELPYSNWLHFQPWPDSTEEPVIDRQEVARIFTQAMPTFNSCFDSDSMVRSAKMIVKLDHTKQKIKAAVSTKDEVEKRELRCLKKAVEALKMPPSDNNTLIIFSYTPPLHR